MQCIQTLIYQNRPGIRAWASIVGPKEGKGPMSADFDVILDDDLLGCESFELAESEMCKRAIELAVKKGGLDNRSIDALLCGDLLNQIYASGFAARALQMPFFGLYGACSTVIEALVLGAALVDGGYRRNCVCAASSHFCSAERQFRFPLELGVQRPPAAQWTATAAGALLVDSQSASVVVTHGTIGRVIDYDITDANHMGAAMAPAVADTYQAHMKDTGRTHVAYDLIVTGDLGHVGRALLLELLTERGMPVPEEKLFDCGANLFAADQDVHAGASGCGCIASVLTGHCLPMIVSGKIVRLLALGSGAMLSPVSALQGQSIPGISYAVAIERGIV